MEIDVIDAPCGYGKTTWAIQYMNQTHINSNICFIYVTPFLSEVKRVKEAVDNRKLYEPIGEGKTKLEDVHNLIKLRRDIVTTHEMFKKFNKETFELLQDNLYILILDEVVEVVSPIKLSNKDDLTLLYQSGVIKNEFNKYGQEIIVWDEKYANLDSRYNDVRTKTNTGNVCAYDNKNAFWQMPLEQFESFHCVFIMTNFFKGQIIKTYFDMFNVKYKYFSIKKDGNVYEPIPYIDRELVDKNKLKELIYIYSGKHNDIGERRNAFSKADYKRLNSEKYKELCNKVRNVLMNVLKAKASDTIWTCLKGENDFILKKMKIKDYKSSFISVTERATNQYSDKTNLAYLSNRFLNPMTKKYFQKYGVSIDEETWALSELIQWVWRSAIRNGQPINLYIPSKRMRDLLVQYLNSEEYEKAPEQAVTNGYPSDWHL